MRNKIYYFSYYYPPIPRARSRFYFSKYLSEAGFSVEVFTVDSKNNSLGQIHLDFSVDVPKSIKITRIKEPNLFKIPLIFYRLNLFYCPFVFWGKKLSSILKKQKFDFGWIFATYPPMTDITAAFEFHKYTNFPLIIDFRDDLIKVSNFNLIKKILKKSLIISVSTPNIAESLKKKFKIEEKFLTVLNGYGDKYNVSEKLENKDKIKIIYAGAATEAQKPDLLIHAFKKIKSHHPKLAEKIEIIYYCPQTFYFKNNMKHLFEDNIRYGGFLDFDKVYQELEKADALYLSLSGSEYSYAFPGKLADYVNLEKPLIASLPDGFAKNLILLNNLGFVSDAGNIDKLYINLIKILQNPNILEEYKQNVIKSKNMFGMKQQIQKLADKIINLQGKFS